jgi:protoporphyrinogen/coproporphyrinogen III oxidase
LRVVVIGGGISGLACGHGLAAALPNHEVCVLEASGRPGGVIGTTEVDGFRFDDGPGGWLNRDDSTQTLIEAVGLESSLIEGKGENRVRYVWKGGRLRCFPSDLRSFLSTDLLSLPSKLRLLAEPLIPWGPNDVDTDVASLFERRIGHEAMRALIDPVLAGIYAGRPEDLSLRATLPAVAKLTTARRSFVRQAFANRKSGAGVGGGYGSLRSGMGALPAAVAKALAERFVPHAPVESIRREGDRWCVSVGGDEARDIVAEAVVVATPARVSERLVGGLDPELESFFAHVPTRPVAVVGLGYAEEDTPSLRGFGHLVPSTESGSVLGVLWSSSVFEGRAEHGVSLRVILGGWRDAEVHTRTDEELTRIARDELSASLGITVAPEALAVARHPQGLPQYRVGHLERVDSLRSALTRHPGLFIIGNAVHGVGVNACTTAAAHTATGVADYCRSLA